MNGIRLSQLKSEADEYSKFTVIVKSIFSPIGITARFDRIMVNLGASPFIGLKYNDSYMCIRNIKSIRRSKIETESCSYRLSCLDAEYDPPVRKQIELVCEK